MSSAIYPDPPRLVTAVCGHGEQQRLSNARLRLTFYNAPVAYRFYNAPVAYRGPARPGSAFQQSAVSGLLPRARARREIPNQSSVGTQQLQIRPTCRSGGRSKLFEIQSSQLALTEKQPDEKFAQR